MLGLKGLVTAGPVIETASMLTIPVESAIPAVCANCPGAGQTTNGRDKSPLIIADTPMWGRPVQLVQPRRKLKCKRCGSFLYRRCLDFHPKRAMTLRLMRYVENAVTKRNIADVAREVALTEKQVWTIATEFAARLKANHRFPQPDVVAMDGIKCNDTRFQIISDGRTGRALAINKTWEADKAWSALRDAVDVTQVRVFVTDMHLTNKSLAKTLREKTRRGSLHVADRFHVIHTCNKAVSRIINVQVNQLRGKNKATAASELLALKAKIEGKRTPQEKLTQIEFDFDNPPSLAGYPTVQLAHRARMQLGRIYKSADRETARRRLHEFDRLASHPDIVERFKPVLSYLRDHEGQVLNYFDALEVRGDGELVGFDTSKAERRNSDIKQIWRATRGEGSDLFRLRVLYHPYTFGTHIIEHGCGHFEGPLAPDVILTAAQMPLGSLAKPACEACSGGACQSATRTA